MKSLSKKILPLIAAVFCTIGVGTTAYAQNIDFNQEWEYPAGNPDTLTRTVSYPTGGWVYVLSSTRSLGGDMDVSLTKFSSLGVLIWQQTYDHDALADYGVDLVVSDNNIYVLAVVNDSVSMTDFCLLKYNSSGVLQWDRITDGGVDGFDGPTDIGADSNGDIYVVGSVSDSTFFSDIFIQKVTPSNTVVWDETYDYADYNDAGGALNIYTDHITVAGVSASDVDVYDNVCLFLDKSDGSLLSENRDEIEDGLPDYFQSYTSDEANNYYILGTSGIGSAANVKLYKVSEGSGLVWSATLDNGLEDIGTSVVSDASGNVYICGQTYTTEGSKMFLSKYDIDGDPLWSKTFSPNPTSITRGTDLKIMDNGNILVTGVTSENSDHQIVTVCFSEDGEIRRALYHNDAVYMDRDPKISVYESSAYITGVIEENSFVKGHVLKISYAERTIDTTYVDSAVSHVSGELIIRFSKHHMLASAVNKVGYNFGRLDSFVDSATLDSLEAHYPPVAWERAKARKIFTRLTMNDSISIARSGDSIPTAPLWATLVVEIPGFDEIEAHDSLFGKGSPNLYHVQFNSFCQATEPDDNHWGEQDAMNGDEAAADIKVLEAWDYETGKEAIRVGVYDTGLKWDHEDFGGGFGCSTCVVQGGWDYQTQASIYNTDNQGDPIIASPFSGHGTKVSGIIGAIRNNSDGVAGIAGGDGGNNDKGVSLYGFKVLATGLTVAEICEALIEGTYNTNTGVGFGLHVMNNSWSSTSYFWDEPIALRQLETACQQEIFRNQTVFVASRGNDASVDEKFPNFSMREYMVVNVGGMGTNGFKHPSSTWAGGVDLIAPYTSTLTYTTDNVNTSAYNTFSGTSASAPHVSGAAALLLSYINFTPVVPNFLLPEDVEFLLQRYATDVTGSFNGDQYATGYDVFSGHGKLNIGNVFTHIDKSQYIIRHYTGESTMSNTPTPVYEDVLAYYDQGDHTTGSYVGDVYELSLTIPNSLYGGDVIVNSWPLHTFSNVLKFADPSLGIQTNNFFESTIVSIDNTNTVLKGYTVHFTQAPNNGPAVDFWYPVAPGEAYKMGYTLHLESAYAGINENINSPFVCYPNPTNDELHIGFSSEFSGSAEITIFDISGKLIFSNTVFQDMNTISTESWPNGMYIVNVIINNEMYHEKVVKQ